MPNPILSLISHPISLPLSRSPSSLTHLSLLSHPISLPLSRSRSSLPPLSLHLSLLSHLISLPLSLSLGLARLSLPLSLAVKGDHRGGRRRKKKRKKRGSQKKKKKKKREKKEEVDHFSSSRLLYPVGKQSMIIFFLHCFVFGVFYFILKIRVVGEFDSEFFGSLFFFFLGIWNFNGFSVCSS